MNNKRNLLKYVISLHWTKYIKRYLECRFWPVFFLMNVSIRTLVYGVSFPPQYQNKLFELYEWFACSIIITPPKLCLPQGKKWFLSLIVNNIVFKGTQYIHISRSQGRSQPHSPGWAKVPLFSFFIQILINFSSNFTYFLPHFGPPGGRVATREGPGYATARSVWIAYAILLYLPSWRIIRIDSKIIFLDVS